MCLDKITGRAGRAYRGEDQAARVARRRQQFLEAGLELIGTLGYRAATVRALCKEAGLTDRYFYESFEDTEALFEAVYLECIARMQARLLEALGQLGPNRNMSEVVRFGLDAFFALMEDSRLARVCYVEGHGISPATSALYLKGAKQFARLVLAWARQMFPALRFDTEADEIMAIAAIGGVNEVVRAWIGANYAISREVLVAGTATVFDGLHRVATSRIAEARAP